MSSVHEVLDAFPFDRPVLTVRRREELLLADALPGPFTAWREEAVIEAVHCSPMFAPQGFGPPEGVYEGDSARVERQVMDNRQSLYHRNLDADELSFQVAGTRTHMTELGTVDLEVGDYSRTPKGVAHDNFGHEDVHLIFYLSPSVDEQQLPTKLSEVRVPPFPDWQPTVQNEVFGVGLGSPSGVIGAFPIDEEVLLGEAEHQSERIAVLRPNREVGTTWLYASTEIWIGETRLARDDGRTYRRHTNCDEIQYQISGSRTLVTQRGALYLEPGDFVRIPSGIAFSSIAAGQSDHITLISSAALPRVAAPTAKGERLSVDELEELRRQP